MPNDLVNGYIIIRHKVALTSLPLTKIHIIPLPHTRHFDWFAWYRYVPFFNDLKKVFRMRRYVITRSQPTPPPPLIKNKQTKNKNRNGKKLIEIRSTYQPSWLIEALRYHQTNIRLVFHLFKSEFLRVVLFFCKSQPRRRRDVHTYRYPHHHVSFADQVQ